MINININIKNDFNSVIYLVYQSEKLSESVNLFYIDNKILIHNTENNKYIELIRGDWVIIHKDGDVGYRIYNTSLESIFDLTYSNKYNTLNKKPFLIINGKNNYFIKSVIDLDSFTEDKRLKHNWNFATIWDSVNNDYLYNLLLPAMATGCILSVVVLETIIPMFIWIAIYLIIVLFINR